jgi:hypothetical protein
LLQGILVNLLAAIQRNDETYAATVVFHRGLQSAIAKARATTGPVLLTPWETSCVEAVEQVTGLELLVPESFTTAVGTAVERARHDVRDGAGRWAPAPPLPASQHHPMDGTADDELTITGLPNGLGIPTNMPWRHSGNTLLR